MSKEPRLNPPVSRDRWEITANTPGLDVPLHIRGTAFQQLVWQALCEIPAGTTATYSEVARRIGMPRAVRAVASACAANKVAVAIPCHRVVRKDGPLADRKPIKSGKGAGIQRWSEVKASEPRKGSAA